MPNPDETGSLDAAEKAYVQATNDLSLKSATAELAKVEQGTEPSAPVAENKPARPAKAKARVIKAKEASVLKDEAIKVVKTQVTKTAKTAKTQTVKAVKRIKAARPATVKSRSIPFAKLKDTIMAAKTTDYTKTIKTAFADVKAKAKVGLEKGAAVAGEATEFSKGNAEALLQSGKILAAGMKDVGQTCVAEAQAVVSSATADLKELATIKAPADLLKLQGDIARRNFEQAVAFGSQTSEALLKIAGEAYAPISSRIALAMEKVRKAA